MSNTDIKKINKSLEEADKGFLLSFPAPPSGSIKQQDIYRYDFDVAYRLPLTPLSEITFTPSLPNNPSKASYLASFVNSNINIGLSIKSIHKSETQTLIRLNIKDIYNNLLYTDYISIICSPKQSFQLKGEILSRFAGNTEAIGPNGGRILRISMADTTTDALSQLLRRMRVEGPGIPPDQNIIINNFIDDNRSDIELLPFFDIANEFTSNSRSRGTYRFSIVTSCTSAEDLKAIEFNNQYIVLDYNNNWSFSFQNKKIAFFIPNTGLSTNSIENIAILLDVKNFDTLIGENTPNSVFFSSLIYAAGRDFSDTTCISSL
jgi:hypothetical protein